MNVLITCKYEEDPIKNRGARVLTTLYVNFSDTQGQITLEWVVVFVKVRGGGGGGSGWWGGQGGCECNVGGRG